MYYHRVAATTLWLTGSRGNAIVMTDSFHSKPFLLACANGVRLRSLGVSIAPFLNFGLHLGSGP
jgi:hypothetical protein